MRSRDYNAVGLVVFGGATSICVIAAATVVGEALHSGFHAVYLGVLCHLVLSVSVLWYGRRDVGSPLCVFILVTIVAFSAPLAYKAYLGDELSSYGPTLLVFIVGYLAFIGAYAGVILGSSTPRQPTTAALRAALSGLNVLRVCAVLYIPIVAVSVYLRSRYTIGLPGVESTLAGSGIIYYLSTTGLLYLLALIGTGALVNARYRLLFAIYAPVYALYESYFGWRGGLSDVLLLLALLTVFGSRMGLVAVRWKVPLYGIVGLPLLHVVLTTRNSVRQASDGVVSLWERLWGIDHLRSVVNHYDDWRNYVTNEWTGLDLLAQGQSISFYHNKMLIGEGLDKINGISSTGFGSAFIFGGVVAVTILFIALGLFYCLLYRRTLSRCAVDVALIPTSTLLISMLQRVLTEQADLGVFKEMTVIALFYVAFRYALRHNPGLHRTLKTERVSSQRNSVQVDGVRGA